MVAHQLKSRSSSASDQWRSSDVTAQRPVVAVAVLSADPVVRGRFEQLSQYGQTVTVVGRVGNTSDLLGSAGAWAIDVAGRGNPSDEQVEPG